MTAGSTVLRASMCLALAVAVIGCAAPPAAKPSAVATEGETAVSPLTEEEIGLVAVRGLELEEGGEATLSASEAVDAADVGDGVDARASLFTVGESGDTQVPEGATVWIVSAIREAAPGAGVDEEWAFSFVDANSGDVLFVKALPCTGTPC